MYFRSGLLPGNKSIGFVNPAGVADTLVRCGVDIGDRTYNLVSDAVGDTTV